MLDLGWQEFVMVAIVLVLVVGPKDMPRVLRSFTKYIGKMRSMARDFQNNIMEVANQDEFRAVKDALQDVKTSKIDALADFAEVKKIATESNNENTTNAENSMMDGVKPSKKTPPKKKPTPRKAAS
ncbi:MAG: Sec-independent protein translocase protein TatB [Candidatus Puniceispirillales bacterium WSBS_2018_MAG_OTU23]